MHRCTPLRTSRSRCLLLLSTLALIASDPARAATHIVGIGSGCTQSTVQAAITQAESSAGADTIRVTRSTSHNQQALVIATAQTLEISGGFATCAQASSDGINTTLNGAGGTAAPVLRISVASGGEVSLRNLTIEGGDVGGVNYGGGIYFSGNGSLRIADSGIINNQSGYGGGIYAEGTGDSAELIIGANVTIASNVAAYSGGGIYLDGIEMSMREPGSLVINNHANGSSDTGYGGGILILSTTDLPAVAYIAGGGVGGGSIIANQARYGGGVAVVGAEGADQQATLILYTVDASRPEQVRGNTASVAGGGLYVRPNAGFTDSAFASARLYRVALDGNSAPNGAAAFMDSTSFAGIEYGGVLSVNAYNETFVTALPSDALPCPSGQPCASISGNIARTSGGQATTGAILELRSGGVSFGPRDGVGGPQTGGTLLTGNQGGRLVDSNDSYLVKFDNTVMHGNALSLEIARVVGLTGGAVGLRGSTIAGNAIGSTRLFTAEDSNVIVDGTILWQPGKTSLVQSGGARTVNATIASEVASLGGGPGAIVTEPRFIDPPRGDYRLRAASPAIDYAAPVAGDDRDVHGLPRDQRIVGVPRPAGRVRDVGAYERPSLQPIVLNGDYDLDLNLWTSVTTGAATRDASVNATGVIGSGSAKVAFASVPQGRIVALTQCIHLPAPGVYQLNGSGRSGIGTAAERDAVILAWEYRSNGGEVCNAGAPTLGGDHLLTRAASWVQPSIPATIVVPVSEWNFQSSIAVSLVVIDNGLSTPGSVLGWFDGITLTVDGSDVLFANGFDG